MRTLWCSLPERVSLSGATMGTTWAVTLSGAGRSREDLVSAREAVEARLERVNRLMSTWDPESELSLWNASSSTDPQPLSPETLEVLRIARDVGGRSGGALDVTVRPLVAAWGFGAGARAAGQGPDAQELASLRERVGWSRLDLRPGQGTARKLHPALECDLSAIAKGWAVDEVLDALVAQGWDGILVEIGGEVRARGERPGGGPWRLGIEQPDEEGRVVRAAVELADRAMATSGDYRAFYEEGGVRRHHIIDPRTGRPAEHALASVSVVHADAARADAWATALMVLGPEEGLRVAEREGLAAYFIARQPDGGYRVTGTRAFPRVIDPRDERPAGE